MENFKNKCEEFKTRIYHLPLPLYIIIAPVILWCCAVAIILVFISVTCYGIYWSIKDSIGCGFDSFVGSLRLYFGAFIDGLTGR